MLEHGFAIVQDALSAESCSDVLYRCMAVTEEMLSIDVKRHGNRGGGRYSMGSAAANGQQLHNAGWALLLSDAVLDALDSIYGQGGYVLRGGGGEVVLGGVDEYQDLHADISRVPPSCDTQLRPPMIVVNYAVHNINEDHGPTRIWPAHGRPRLSERPMRQDTEPRDVLLSTLAPLPLGSCVVRDARIWHGGTPNYREYPRYLPNLEFVSREYAEHLDAEGKASRFHRRTMTAAVFSLLSPRAQRVAEALVTHDDVPQGILPHFVRPQGKVFREQILARLSALQIGGTFWHSGNGRECHEIREVGESHGFACQLTRRGPAFSVSVTRVL